MKDNEFLGELGWFRDKGKGLHGWKSPKIEGRYLVVLDRDGQVHGVRGDSEVVFRTENPDGVSVDAILTMQASWTYGATVPADVGAKFADRESGWRRHRDPRHREGGKA